MSNFQCPVVWPRALVRAFLLFFQQKRMIFQRLKTGIEVSDTDFDTIYSDEIRAVSEIHFTPVEVAKIAADYLVDKPGTKVLDIGSGAGKFCMIGAACTDGFFTGVERRKNLFQLSEILSKSHSLSNTDFIHADIMEIEFPAFNAIYFFNSFYENLFQKEPIDDSVKLDKRSYAIYSQFVREQLCKMPVGTRLATYFSYLNEVPLSYKVQAIHFDDKLKLWEKTA